MLHLHYHFKSDAWKHLSLSSVILQAGKLQLLKWTITNRLSWLCAQLLSILGNTDKNVAWWIVSQSQVPVHLHWSESFRKSWTFSCLALSSCYMILCSRCLKCGCLFSVNPFVPKGSEPWSMWQILSDGDEEGSGQPQMQVEPILRMLSLQAKSPRSQTTTAHLITSNRGEGTSISWELN